MLGRVKGIARNNTIRTSAGSNIFTRPGDVEVKMIGIFAAKLSHVDDMQPALRLRVAPRVPLPHWQRCGHARAWMTEVHAA
jgi:hypothetical protein